MCAIAARALALGDPLGALNRILVVQQTTPTPIPVDDALALLGLEAGPRAPDPVRPPVAAAVDVAVPGRGRSGLAGDRIGNGRDHGGNDQAVYAYAREDLDEWMKAEDLLS